MKVEEVSNNDIKIYLSFNYSTLVSNSKRVSNISASRLLRLIIPDTVNYEVLDKDSVLYQKVSSTYRHDLSDMERQIDI